MTTSELVAAVYLKAAGKQTTLEATDTKYLKIVGIANSLIRKWQSLQDWASLYNPAISLTPTVTATNTFALHSTIRKISDTRGDYVRIYWTDGINYTDFEMVPADTLKQYDSSANACAQIGTNLKFSRTFATTDAEYGGTIKVPAYTFVTELDPEDEDGVIPVDIPEWLVIMAAAEYVRNDITKQSQYPNLVQEANELMERMIDDNDAQVNEVLIPWTPQGRTW